MDLVLGRLPAQTPDEWDVEIVERNGIGHPDTISDALPERLSVALSRLYLERFGAILHHNVDKALLRAGVSRPAFGGAENPFQTDHLEHRLPGWFLDTSTAGE